MIEIVADATVPHGANYLKNMPAGLTPDAGDASPALQSYRQIHELFVLLEASDRQVLDNYGLIGSQFRLLMRLDPNSGQRLTALSDHLLLSKSTITRLVDQLEERGLVRRVPDRDDRRALRVVLTETGSQQRSAVAQLHTSALKERFNCLHPQEQAQLQSLIGRLCTCLSGLLSPAAAEPAGRAGTSPG